MQILEMLEQEFNTSTGFKKGKITSHVYGVKN